MPKRTYLGEEESLRLINEVKSRPCIWNPEDKDYNVKFSLVKAWTEITCAMNLPGSFLRSKWKNLRDMYKKELKKHNGESSSTWHYFNELKFLAFKGDTSEIDTVEVSIEAEMEAADKEIEELDEETEVEVKCEPLETEEVHWSEEDPIPDNIRKTNDVDFDVMFLKSLTPYFKQLGPLRRLAVRNKIQNMLLNEITAQNYRITRRRKT